MQSWNIHIGLYVLTNGCELNLKAVFGDQEKTILHEAIIPKKNKTLLNEEERDFCDFVEQLIEKDPDTLVQSDTRDRIPLHDAAKAGFLDIVDILLRKSDIKGMVDFPSKLCLTPLHKAAWEGHTKVLEKLIQCKVM